MLVISSLCFRMCVLPVRLGMCPCWYWTDEVTYGQVESHSARLWCSAQANFAIAARLCFTCSAVLGQSPGPCTPSSLLLQDRVSPVVQASLVFSSSCPSVVECWDVRPVPRYFVLGTVSRMMCLILRAASYGAKRPTCYLCGECVGLLRILIDTEVRKTC